jgi:hypothetical protein
MHVMKKTAAVVVMTAAMAVGLIAPASAATADPRASCAGLAGASRSGQPGAEAAVVHDVLSFAFPPGQEIFSDFARHHQGTAEACLD